MRTNNNTIGTATVSTELLGRFNKEVTNYANMLQKSLSGEMLFGSPVKMPAKNLLDITNEFIQLSTVQLTKTGLKTTRAKSISKYTFEKALEEKMNSLES